MLLQKYRFHSRGGVNYVYQKGKNIRMSNLVLFYAPNTRGYRRFAVVISKKIVKSAVGRNRIRRRLYEAIRLELPINLPPTDYVLVVHSKSYSSLPFLEIRRTVSDLFLRANENR